MPPKRAAPAAVPMAERLSRSFRRIPAEDTPRLFRLRLAEIEPNPDQPRKQIDEEALRELAGSIEQHGLIQPITVKRLPDSERYLLIAGERRFRAHQLLGRENILAIVTVGSADEISLIENIQRQDLHPLEEAAAYARMMKRHGWTQEELARTVGKARPTVTNILKLNRLPEPIREQSMAIVGEGPSKSALFEIARLDSPQAQLALWEKVRAGATVRAARDDSAAVEGSGGKKGRDPLNGTIAAGRRFLRALRDVKLGQSSGDARSRGQLLRLGREIEEALTQLRAGRRPASDV